MKVTFKKEENRYLVLVNEKQSDYIISKEKDSYVVYKNNEVLVGLKYFETVKQFVKIRLQKDEEAKPKKPKYKIGDLLKNTRYRGRNKMIGIVVGVYYKKYPNCICFYYEIETNEINWYNKSFKRYRFPEFELVKVEED